MLPVCLRCAQKHEEYEIMEVGHCRKSRVSESRRLVWVQKLANCWGILILGETNVIVRRASTFPPAPLLHPPVLRQNSLPSGPVGLAGANGREPLTFNAPNLTVRCAADAR